jgi:DNA polymerase-3 subunit delta'
LVVVERQGASIAVDQVDDVIRLAARSPAEGDRKVLVLVDFHLVAQQYPRLLKTLEEPPASTVFVILAEHIPAELATIASRCVRIDFGPVPTAEVVGALVATGVDGETAERAAAAAGGRLDRAHLLASDPGFGTRLAAWRSVPERLDGTGAAVTTIVDEVLAATDSVLEPLRARQAAEAGAMKERIEAYGERGAGRRELEERHRREQRRVRTDELRFGLATLAAAYRDRLAAGGGAGDAGAVAAVQETGEALIRNPSEPLLLAALFCRLSNLRR